MNHLYSAIDFGLHNMITHMPSCAFIKDRAGYILYGNTLFEEHFGLNDPDYPLMPEALPNLQIDPICKIENAVLETQSSQTGIDVHVTFESGLERIFVFTCMPWLKEDEAVMGTIQILRDVTLVRENEQALTYSQNQLQIALEREKELNDMKTRFISTISHEYRNPLAAIRTSVETLLRLGDRVDADMRRKRFEKIILEIQRMTELMEDVLFIGREEATKSHKKYEPVDVADLTTSFISDLDQSEQTRISLNMAGKPRPIIGVPLHLSQIVQNLIGNALKYSEDEVSVNLIWEDDLFRFAVQDQGIGIPPPDQSNIFESFFRSQKVGMITGTGLGLFIVKRAVDIHDGTISFESEVNKGTSISVSIPIVVLSEK
ncbi:MAG: HAMP domain-containing sensor histidine kinase [Chloroflexota bacterium]